MNEFPDDPSPALTAAPERHHQQSQPVEMTRSLPYALGIEKSILSRMLQEPVDMIPLMIERRITEQHFYLPSHALLFGTLIDRHEAGHEIEIVALMQHLLDNGKLDRIGGPSTLADLATYSPSTLGVEQHIIILREKRMLRATIQLCTESINSAYDDPEKATDLLDEVETRLMEIRDGERPPNNVTQARDAVRSVMHEVNCYASGVPSNRGLTTGFDQLDAMTGGLMPGEVFVIAARPSMGKTSMMTNIVEHVAVDCKKRTLVFSCEMTTHQLTSRIAYTRARFRASKMTRKESLTKGDLLDIQRALLDVGGSPLIIDDTAAITISELRAKARRIQRNGGLALVAVDYLQLLHSRSKQANNSREREVSEISSGLKALAKEMRVPIIVLAQLNRESEKRGGKSKGVPRLSDLRESGGIEQDADQVGLLHRDAYFAEDDEERKMAAGQARLILAKNRNGATGEIPLTFIAELMRFESGAPVADTPEIDFSDAPRQREF